MKIKENCGEWLVTGSGWTQGSICFEDGRWGSFVKVNVNESQR